MVLGRFIASEVLRLALLALPITLLLSLRAESRHSALFRDRELYRLVFYALLSLEIVVGVAAEAAVFALSHKSAVGAEHRAAIANIWLFR